MEHTRKISLLEYDISKSMQYRIQEFTQMSTALKNKKQEEYLKALVECIKGSIYNEESKGSFSIKALPEPFYPFAKMKNDIILALKQSNIKVTRITNIREKSNNHIVGCYMYWKRLTDI